MLNSSNIGCMESSRFNLVSFLETAKPKLEEHYYPDCNSPPYSLSLQNQQSTCSPSSTSSVYSGEDMQGQESLYDQRQYEKSQSEDSFSARADAHNLFRTFFDEEDQDDLKRKSSKPMITKLWTSEEDNLLQKLGVTYKNDWKKIVKRFIILRGIKRSPTFLRERFRELTSSSLQNKSKFSHQEDLRIVELIEKHGMNWIELAKHLPSRGPIMIKNRYYSFIRKNNLYSSLMEELKRASNESKEEKPQKSRLKSRGKEIDFIEYDNEALVKDSLKDIDHMLETQKTKSYIEGFAVETADINDGETILGK